MTTRKALDLGYVAELMEMVPDAIIGIDVDGATLFANAQAASLFGYGREELVGQPVERLLPGSLRAALAGRPASGDRPPSQPARIAVRLTAHRRDGTEFRCEVSLTWYQVADALSRRSRARDVAELTSDRVRFRGVVEAAADAAVGVNRAGLIARVNPEAEELFGYTRTELIDHPMEMLVRPPTPDDAQHAPPQSNLHLNAETPLEGRRKDGSEFPVEISLSAVDTKAGPLVSAAIRDASDRAEIRREQDRADVQNGT